jgi:Carboxylesterase family
MWTWARLQSRTGTGKVYFYRFSHVTTFPKDSPMWGMGAAHGFELIYTFGHTDYLPNTATAVDRKMVEVLASYWTNFAISGNPNAPVLPLWPEFTERAPLVMDLGQPLEARPIDPADLAGLRLQDRYLGAQRFEHPSEMVHKLGKWRELSHEGMQAFVPMSARGQERSFSSTAWISAKRTFRVAALTSFHAVTPLIRGRLAEPGTAVPFARCSSLRYRGSSSQRPATEQ